MEGSSFECEPMMTAKQLAELLNVTQAQAYNLGHSGQLPYHQIGRSIRFTKADVEKFLKRTRRCETKF